MILSSGYCWHKLVHCWMQEMYYSTKRQQFLIDQGYSFKVSFLSESPHKTSIWCISLELYSYIVCEQWNYSQIITSLPPSDSGPELSYHRLDEQLALLSKVSLLSWLTIEFIRLMSQRSVRWFIIFIAGSECWRWCSWFGAVGRRYRWYCSPKGPSFSQINECHVWSKRDGLHGIQVYHPILFCFFFFPAKVSWHVHHFTNCKDN